MTSGPTRFDAPREYALFDASHDWDVDVRRSGRACHYEHPALELGGGRFTGGSCGEHAHVGGITLLVALDRGTARPPLFSPGNRTPSAALYPIQNMRAPHVPEKFDALLNVIVAELASGGHVHVGCIGGHGRTGLVLAALCARLSVSDDPIAWAREHYCRRAVESSAQVQFLEQHYGCPAHGVPVLGDDLRS